MSDTTTADSQPPTQPPPSLPVLRSNNNTYNYLRRLAKTLFSTFEITIGGRPNGTFSAALITTNSAEELEFLIDPQEGATRGDAMMGVVSALEARGMKKISRVEMLVQQRKVKEREKRERAVRARGVKREEAGVEIEKEKD